MAKSSEEIQEQIREKMEEAVSKVEVSKPQVALNMAGVVETLARAHSSLEKF